jgi:F-type H+-transporting ATPase subunit a
MTFPLAFASFLLFQFAGLMCRPKAYLKGIFLEPVFIFAPINVIGELAKPVAMSFRLFGNIIGGMILMQLLYGLAPYALRFVFPAALHLYFDLAAGALQAFIFTMLSITFVGIAAKDD